MSTDRSLQLALVAVAFIMLAAGVQAQVPQVINYQGQLTDASGNPENGTFTMIFKIFDAAFAGTQLYAETQSVTVSNGVFNVLIGSVNPIPLNLFDSGTERHLEVTVDRTALSPRRRFGSVPYAFASHGGSGAITAVNAGTGLTGGGTSGAVTVALNTSFTDGQYVNEGQASSISSSMIQDGQVTNSDLANNAVNSAKIQDGTIQQADLGFSAGDITAVNAGSGLTGGATSGNVTLSVANNEITSAMIQDNTIVNADVNTNAAIAGTKISPNFGSQNIVTTGKVGIGTSTPVYLLDVRPDVRTTSVGLNVEGTSQYTVRVTNNASGAAPFWAGYFRSNAGGGATASYGVWGEAAGTSAQNVGGHFQASGGTENFAIYSANGKNYFAGNVGIGTSNPANILTVQRNSATDPVADAWTTYSSKRWKTNIRTVSEALDKVQRLRGVYYDWKADGKRDIGLIAEEVGEVIPEVVTYEEDSKDASSVDYARLVALLIEAVKEQQREIAELKSTVQSLVAAKQMGNNSVGE